MQTSPLFSLNFKDLGKGLLVAVGGAVIAAIETSIQAGSLTFNWKTIGGVALAAGLSYLVKNLFTLLKLLPRHNRKLKTKRRKRIKWNSWDHNCWI